MQLLAKHWQIIAKALRFARDVCEEPEAQPILNIIGEHGENAESAPAQEEPSNERTD